MRVPPSSHAVGVGGRGWSRTDTAEPRGQGDLPQVGQVRGHLKTRRPGELRRGARAARGSAPPTFGPRGFGAQTWWGQRDGGGGARSREDPPNPALARGGRPVRGVAGQPGLSAVDTCPHKPRPRGSPLSGGVGGSRSPAARRAGWSCRCRRTASRPSAGWSPSSWRPPTCRRPPAAAGGSSGAAPATGNGPGSSWPAGRPPPRTSAPRTPAGATQRGRGGLPGCARGPAPTRPGTESPCGQLARRGQQRARTRECGQRAPGTPARPGGPGVPLAWRPWPPLGCGAARWWGGPGAGRSARRACETQRWRPRPPRRIYPDVIFSKNI